MECIGVANALITNLSVLKEHVLAYLKLRKVLSGSVSRIDAVVVLLSTLKYEEQDILLSSDILDRAKNRQRIINLNVKKLHHRV